VKCLGVTDRNNHIKVSNSVANWFAQSADSSTIIGIRGAVDPQKSRLFGPAASTNPEVDEKSLVIFGKSKNYSSELKQQISKLPYALPALITKSTAMGTGSRPRNKARKQKSTVLLSQDGTTWGLFSQSFPHTKIARVNNKVYNIQQQVDGGVVTSVSTSTPVYLGLNFAISQLDQVTQLAAVFDQYRINQIEVWINIAGQGLAGSGTTCKWASAVDYDDSNAPTTYGQVLDYQNAVQTLYDVGHYRVFTPHIAVAAYSGAFTSYANETAPWIDFTSQSVQHFGLKCAFETATGSNNAVVAQYRFHVSFRNVR